MVKERNSFLDILKGVLIILVLVGHFGGDNTGNSSILNSIYFFIYVFHMPMFVFISGYLSKNLDRSKKRGFENIVDFVLFQIIWAIFSCIVLGDKSYLELIWQPGYALWYILALGIWKYFLKDLLKIRYILIISFIIAIFSICTVQFQPVLAIPRIVGFLPFFLLGFITKESFFEKIKKIPTVFSVIFMIGIFVLSFYIVKETNINYLLLYHNCTYTEIIAGPENIINVVVLNALSYVFAIATGINFMNVCKKLEKNTFLIKIGQRTLPIYILSNYMQKILFIVQHKIIGEKIYLNDCANYFIALLFVIITIYVCSSDFVVNKFNMILEKWRKIVIKENA